MVHRAHRCNFSLLPQDKSFFLGEVIEEGAPANRMVRLYRSVRRTGQIRVDDLSFKADGTLVTVICIWPIDHVAV